MKVFVVHGHNDAAKTEVAIYLSVPVRARAKGGFAGEIDVVAIHLATNHLLHAECSLDALSAEKREERFAAKFERGRRT